MSHHDEHARWRAVIGATPPRALPPEDADGMLAHADQCAACAPALRNFAAHALTGQAPPVQMEAARSAEIRGRLLAAAAAQAGAARASAHPIPIAGRARRTRGYVSAVTGAGGWMAAAALFVALLTHHAFHEPLRAGWTAAAAFALLALGLGVHALVQRRRLADLERRLEPHGDGADPRR